MKPTPTKPLYPSKLAKQLGVTTDLIDRMLSRGFRLNQDGTATVQQALEWLQSNPYPLNLEI